MDTARNFGIPISPKAPQHDAGFIWVYAKKRQKSDIYTVWDGGGALGGEHTEEEALEYLARWAKDRLERRIARLEAELAVSRRSLTVLTENGGLTEFEVPAEWSPARANGRTSY